jgi:hypothetical protein
MLGEENATRIQPGPAPSRDYYEMLQISRHADQETIERVYRIMALRFHPDNRETGDHERFVLLKEAYATLSDPVARAHYDAKHESREQGPLPIFELRDFVDDISGELNRRLGVLCLLYNKRRRDADKPGLSLLQLEQLMSFPREYLMFTMWFLLERGHIRMLDNSDYVLSANGAEYVESKVPSDRLAVALLSQGASDTAQSTSDVCSEPHPADDAALGHTLPPDSRALRMN